MFFYLYLQIHSLYPFSLIHSWFFCSRPLWFTLLISFIVPASLKMPHFHPVSYSLSLSRSPLFIGSFKIHTHPSTHTLAFHHHFNTINWAWSLNRTALWNGVIAILQHVKMLLWFHSLSLSHVHELCEKGTSSPVVM